MIVVTTQFSNGANLVGVYTELALNGNEAATAYTPAAFHTVTGLNYTVVVSDSKGLYFNQWSNGFSSRVIPVTAASSPISLRAVFTTTPEPPSPTPYSISVVGHLLNGTALIGDRVDLRVGGYAIQSGFMPVTFKDLEPELQYQVVAYWYGNDYFRHFADGDLNRYELITFNSTGPTTASFDALYELVPPSQAATLNVIAEFPNGTVIGTTHNSTDYIQHTPGLWLMVTPPGGTQPYSGSDTGGSLLPFVLFRGETYTVQMSSYSNILLSHWSDTGSTNSTRSVTLSQNATTIIAIYEQTGSPSGGSLAALWSYRYTIFVPVPLAQILDKPTSGRRALRSLASVG